MKPDYLAIIKDVIDKDLEQLKQGDCQKELANIEEMINIFNNYETQFVNLNLDLLKPYLQEKPDVFVTLEFIQCLLLGNLNNHLSFELDEEQRGLFVWILRMLETKKQELTNRLSNNNENNSLEERCLINQETYEQLKNNENYLTPKQLTALTDSLTNQSKEEKYAFYQILFNYNNQIYLKEHTSKNKFHEEAKLKELLADYHISYTKLRDETKDILITNHLFEETKQILSKLNEFHLINVFNSYHLLDEILLYTDKETIEKVITTINQNNLALEYLLLLPTIFLKEKSIYVDKKIIGNYNTFLTNIELLKKYDLDLNHLSKSCPCIFIMNSERLQKNLLFKDIYKLSFFNHAKHEGYNFLLAKNFALTVDSYIEADLDLYIQGNQSKICNDDDLVFKRLYFANKKELDFYQQFENDDSYIWLDEEIKKDNGYDINEQNWQERTGLIVLPVNDELDEILNKHDNTIITDLVLKNSWIERLELYCSANQLYYQLKGVKISRFKVLRLFETILKESPLNLKEAFLYVVTYKSLLNQEEYDKIKELIMTICEEGR